MALSEFDSFRYFIAIYFNKVLEITPTSPQSKVCFDLYFIICDCLTFVFFLADQSIRSPRTTIVSLPFTPPSSVQSIESGI